MNELQVFDNAEFGEIRTLHIDGEPWFIGKDIAEALGYRNPSDAIHKHVDNEDKSVVKRDTLDDDKFQKSQNAIYEIPSKGFVIINESGLYSLILSSKMPNAKKFKRWVTSEVLPSLRKTGSYGKSQIEIEDLKKEIDSLKASMDSLTGRTTAITPRLVSSDFIQCMRKMRIRKKLLNYLLQRLEEATNIPTKTQLSLIYTTMVNVGLSPQRIQFEWIDAHDGEEISAFDAICYSPEASKFIIEEVFGELSACIY